MSHFNLAAAICSRSDENSYSSRLRRLQEQDQGQTVSEEKVKLIEVVGADAVKRIDSARTRLRLLMESSSARSIGPHTREELKMILKMLEL